MSGCAKYYCMVLYAVACSQVPGARCDQFMESQNIPKVEIESKGVSDFTLKKKMFVNHSRMN